MRSVSTSLPDSAVARAGDSASGISSLAAAIIVLATGTIVLIGWTFMIEPLKRINPGFVAMNPATAICLIFAGSSLLFLRREGHGTESQKIFGRAAAIVVAFVGLLKIISLCGGWDSSVDRWLFTQELLPAGRTIANRMAPNTALNFVLSGLALLLIDWKTKQGHRPAELLSVVSAMSGLLALSGYIYHTPTFYGVSYFTPMALHTALSFIVLAVGTLLARPRNGMMAVVMSDTAGGVVCRRFLPLAVVLPLLLGFLRLQGQRIGLFELEFGTALYSTTLVVLLLILIWSMARILFRLENERRSIERHHQRQLERTVEERTAELEHALSQLKETQQKIIQQERLHAFGTMASGVAHDFNNTLSVILGFGEMALQECKQKAVDIRVQQCLQTILVAANDGAKMVTHLREFYRPDGDDEPRTAVDLNELIKQAIAITEPKWKTQSLGGGVRIEIKTDLAPLPAVAGDAAELREALTNLIFNAVDAMPKGGSIVLRSCDRDGHVVMELCDTGTGMSEEVRQRCLDPFFTTKGEQGTGLGLAMVYGIIQRHGGTLDIRSAPGHGTTFIISLPKNVAVAQAKQNGTPQVAHPLRVLVADDQPLLCEILAEYLTTDLHTVVTANDGHEALEKFRDGEAFDLVITDQAMPQITGSELARAIKARSPSMPVILATGFGEAPGNASENCIDHVLSKPVSLIDLRHALLRVTAGKATAVDLLIHA